MDRHENERWGAFVEWTARRAFGLTADRSTFHDARGADGRPVEVKGCKRVTGYREDPGKFFIRRENHQKLLDADGRYVFAVYDPQNTEGGPVLNLEMKPVHWIDTLDGFTWTSNGGRRGEVVIRPPWTVVMDRADVADADAVSV